MMKYLVPLAVFGLLVLVFFRGLFLDPSEVPSPLIGKPAPAFELPQLKDPGQTLSSEALQGQVSLVNVWATWCVGCRQEHDALLAIAERNVVPIYGLNYKDERAAAVNWLKQLGDPYVASAFDKDGRVALDWGVYGAPETFLVDASGVVRFKRLGPLSIDDFESNLLPLIRKLQGELK